ncbi:RelA/SpoT family protein [Patescibacteria group bacterium]|nr:RelA/SpoT family protein [Patescibacteria group bacterium]
MTHPSDEIVQAMRQPTDADCARIRQAYDVAERMHGGERRKSGEPYIVHPAAIAKTLATIGADTDTIVAGILHDTIEDTPYTAEEIERDFGSTVRFLVESVTKLSKLRYQGLERHVESLRRLLIATAADIRVIVIKLADRLHNMETLEFVEERKQLRIARETLEIYVPIAERLNMGFFKTQLQDLSFRIVDPTGYADAAAYLETRRSEMEANLNRARLELEEELLHHGIRAETEMRVKGLASFAQKLKRKRGRADAIYDVFAIRIIVESIDDCYRALGVIHALWRPIEGRIKDYIAYPKPNGYRSIHTTVTASNALPVELQIRTREMHEAASLGAVSHLAYKHGSVRWLRELGETLADLDPELIPQILKEDYLAERIFAFTPKDDAIDLPSGATPIDFAYALHSELGDRATHALVNGKLVPLDTPLKNGDRVEIKVRKDGKPNRKWLDSVRTASARKHIRSSLAANRARA